MRGSSRSPAPNHRPKVESTGSGRQIVPVVLVRRLLRPGVVHSIVDPNERGQLFGQDVSEGVEVGSTPVYEFRQPILNGMGATSLADLKGKPTLIDFWGTR